MKVCLDLGLAILFQWSLAMGVLLAFSLTFGLNFDIWFGTVFWILASMYLEIFYPNRRSKERKNE